MDSESQLLHLGLLNFAVAHVLRHRQLWPQRDVEREQRGGPVVQLLEAQVDRGGLHRERAVHTARLVNAPGQQAGKRE